MSTLITNNIVTIEVLDNMRINRITRDGSNLWSNSVDTVHYIDSVNETTKYVDLDSLIWSVNSYIDGNQTYIKGEAAFIDIDNVTLTFDFRYSLETGQDNVEVKLAIDSNTELRMVRGVHYGRARTNSINRNPRVVFERGVEIDYIEYSQNSTLQAIWNGNPLISTNSMGGDSAYSFKVDLPAGVHIFSRSISSEDWSLSFYIFIGLNTLDLVGTNHKIRLYWISNGTTYYTYYKNIDEAEHYVTDWKPDKLLHFFLEDGYYAGTLERGNITEFGIEFSGDGGSFLVDEIWRYEKDDFLPSYSVNTIDYYNSLPFFNATSLTWDRRQSGETFALSYADETGAGGDLLGVAWVGRWSRTSDIIISELDSSSNSYPLNIGGHVKYLSIGLSGLKWEADWYILPMAKGDDAAKMYSMAQSLYESLFSTANAAASASGVGTYSTMPYLWDKIFQPITQLAPDLRRAAAAGITDLILPMGNNGWHTFKPRNFRLDCSNAVKMEGDDRLEFIAKMWLDPQYPERRVFYEATIFDNHYLNDFRDEITVRSNTSSGEDRMFIYKDAAENEYLIKREYSPVDPVWFDSQIINGTVCAFSYQYPRFRPSLVHITRPASFFNKGLNLHNRLIISIGEISTRHNCSGIILSEYFWYTRGFDPKCLSVYNSWRVTNNLSELTDFERANNALSASPENHYKADDIYLWKWKTSEVTNIIADIKAAVEPKLFWINSEADNILSVKNTKDPLWIGTGMVGNNNNVPAGQKGLRFGQERWGTGFDTLNNNPNLDYIWFWNYWGYSRIEAIKEFIAKYCSEKEKIIMAIGIYPGSDPPDADEFEIAIKQARQYGFKISFPGQRNYSETHWQALEAALAAEITVLPCPVTKKTIGMKKFSNLDESWEKEKSGGKGKNFL